MLTFDPNWRFEAPCELPDDAVEGAFALITRLAVMGSEKAVLEQFKKLFGSAAGRPVPSSSSTSFALSDLRAHMSASARNEPLFLEALCDGLDVFSHQFPGTPTPSLAVINRMLQEKGARFEIRPPDLVALSPLTGVPAAPQAPSLEAQAQALIQATWVEAERLLTSGKPRQAVQENLWLLETVATAFKGLPLAEATVRGKYFSKIADELRRHGRGAELTQILNWITTLYGYLSSPSGGGVRHGADLATGLALAPNEAQLYCNLIRSYIAYLLGEYERLKAEAG